MTEQRKRSDLSLWTEPQPEDTVADPGHSEAVRTSIEAGKRDAKAGNTVKLDDARRLLGLR